MQSEFFNIQHRDVSSRARSGILSLRHGDVNTPVFMPVGTNGAVKAIEHEDLEKMGIDIILGNTYHLYLRPGLDVIRSYGGLHSFTTWNRNILTDSGGYQVFSLAPFRKVHDDGVRFRSHIDGSLHDLSPEKVIDIQITLGSDVMMPLDVCTPPGIEYAEAVHALELTSSWARMSKKRWQRSGVEADMTIGNSSETGSSVTESMSNDGRNPKGALFGIVQGNFFNDLRVRSADELRELNFPGYAIGGLSVGEEFGLFSELLYHTVPFLPEDKPRYLMGIGTPEYILTAIENGIDMFDCVFPTRIARNGTVFTRKGTIALKRKEYIELDQPIDNTCTCPVCQRYSCGYIRHLFKAKEILGPMLTTRHNVHFLHEFVRDTREAIQNGSFTLFKEAFLADYAGKHQTEE